MDDYLLNEREQWEAVKRWVRESGPSIVAAFAIVALGFAGYRWWQARESKADLAAGAMLLQMENAFMHGDSAQAFIYLGELERRYPSSPYADQARLTSARAFVEDGELARAADELQQVMQHSPDSILRLIARLRLARVQIALHQPSEALATLNGANPGAMAPQYAQVRGDAYYAMSDKAAALAQYQQAKASDTGGETDTALLDLEISDLSADVAKPAIAAGQAPKQP